MSDLLLLPVRVFLLVLLVFQFQPEAAIRADDQLDSVQLQVEFVSSDNGPTAAQQSSAQTSAAYQDVITDAHNQLRAAVGSSNMDYVIWNATLEYSLRTWLTGCSYNADFRLQWPFNSPTVFYAFKQLTTNLNQTIPTIITGISQQSQQSNLYQLLMKWDMKLIACGAQQCSNRLNGQNVVFQISSCLYAYNSDFNNKPPFLIGPACSQCSSGLVCFNSLCRDADGSQSFTTGPTMSSSTTFSSFYKNFYGTYWNLPIGLLTSLGILVIAVPLLTVLICRRKAIMLRSKTNRSYRQGPAVNVVGLPNIYSTDATICSPIKAPAYDTIYPPHGVLAPSKCLAPPPYPAAIHGAFPTAGELELAAETVDPPAYETVEVFQGRRPDRPEDGDYSTVHEPSEFVVSIISH